MRYILDIDRELFIYLNGLGSAYWDSFWMFLTSPFASIPIYLILFWKSKNKVGWSRILWVILAVAVMITITDQTSNLFKNILVRRLRPCHEESLISIIRLVKAGCGGQYGFFSAHAANSFVVVALFSKFINTKFWTVFLFLWAFLVSYSRIYIGVHYPLDILSGVVYGYLVGIVIYKIFSIFNLFRNKSYYA